jgi:hypothetical protein
MEKSLVRIEHSGGEKNQGNLFRAAQNRLNHRTTETRLVKNLSEEILPSPSPH